MRLHGLGQPLVALAILDSVGHARATGQLLPELIRVEAYTFLGQYDRALAAADYPGVLQNQFYFRPPTLVRGLIHRHAGNANAAAAALDSARALLEAKLEQDPDDSRVMGALAIALAGLDRREAALQLGRRARDELPPAREAWRGAFRVLDLAAVQSMTGRHAEAMINLEWLLSNPSPLSVPGVKLDPTWDPLRHLPAFQGLIDSPAEPPSASTQATSSSPLASHG